MQILGSEGGIRNDLKMCPPKELGTLDSKT
jgi:hypothetical protein